MIDSKRKKISKKVASRVKLTPSRSTNYIEGLVKLELRCMNIKKIEAVFQEYLDGIKKNDSY